MSIVSKAWVLLKQRVLIDVACCLNPQDPEIKAGTFINPDCIVDTYCIMWINAGLVIASGIYTTFFHGGHPE
jgi:hypothetical protein